MSNSLEFLGKAATPLRAAGCNRAVAQSSQWVLILRSRNGGARTKFCVNRFFSEARERTKRQIAGLENRLSLAFQNRPAGERLCPQAASPSGWPLTGGETRPQGKSRVRAGLLFERLLALPQTTRPIPAQ